MDNPNQIVSLPQFAKDRIRKDNGKLKGEKGDPTRDPASGTPMQRSYEHFRFLAEESWRRGDYRGFTHYDMRAEGIRKAEMGVAMKPHERESLQMQLRTLQNPLVKDEAEHFSQEHILGFREMIKRQGGIE